MDKSEQNEKWQKSSDCVASQFPNCPEFGTTLLLPVRLWCVDVWNSVRSVLSLLLRKRSHGIETKIVEHCANWQCDLEWESIWFGYDVGDSSITISQFICQKSFTIHTRIYESHRKGLNAVLGATPSASVRQPHAIAVFSFPNAGLFMIIIMIIIATMIGRYGVNKMRFNFSRFNGFEIKKVDRCSV